MDIIARKEEKKKMIMLNEEIPEKLEQQIAIELNNLNNQDPGSEGHKTCAEVLNKIYKLRIDDVMADLEYNEKVACRENAEEQRKIDNEARKAKEKQDNIRQWVTAVGTIAISVISIANLRDLALKGFEFETDGSMTSRTMLNLFGTIFKKK